MPAVPWKYQRILMAGLQSGVAAGLAWWLGSLLLGVDNPAYAPIAAVVVIGAGWDRRIGRVTSMLFGMGIAIVLSEVGVRALGAGPWQMALVTCLAVVVARVLSDDLLVVSYAGLNAAVLVSLGGEGWIPSRAIEAVVGAATAYGLVYLVFPPRPAAYIESAVGEQVGIAAEVMHQVAESLRAERDAAEPISRSEDLDGKVDALRATFDFSSEVSRLSPWRRRESVDRMAARTRQLRGVLRQVTVLVRLAARLAADRRVPEEHLASAIELEADAVTALVENILASTTRPHRSLPSAVSLTARASELAERTCPDSRPAHVAVVQAICWLTADIDRTVQQWKEEQHEPAVG